MRRRADLDVQQIRIEEIENPTANSSRTFPRRSKRPGRDPELKSGLQKARGRQAPSKPEIPAIVAKEFATSARAISILFIGSIDPAHEILGAKTWTVDKVSWRNS